MMDGEGRWGEEERRPTAQVQRAGEGSAGRRKRGDGWAAVEGEGRRVGCGGGMGDGDGV
jgi:hypothetical protein